MGQSASQASIFYRDVEASGKLWTIKDRDGYPAPLTNSGKRSMPFWSSRSRVEKIIKNVPAYKEFEPVELDLTEFRESWLPELRSSEQLVGINWSGSTAMGLDLDPEILIKWLDQLRPMRKNFFRTLFRRS